MDKSFNDKQLSIEIEFGFSYIHEFGLDEDTFETLRFGGFFFSYELLIYIFTKRFF